MLWDLALQQTAERATLRLRLAAAALASTLLLLSPRDDASSSLVSLAYAIAAGAIFVVGPRVPAPVLAVVSSALDVAFPTALVVFTPNATLMWVLYGFAIGVAGIRRGVGGAIAVTAASLVSYDAALLLHTPKSDPNFIWAVQVLIAMGLIVAEVSSARARDSAELATLRQQSLAFRNVARETGSDALITALLAQAEALCHTDGVWAWRTEAEGPRTLQARGVRVDHPTSGDVVAWLAQEPATFIGATLSGADVTGREAMLRDIVADASPLYVAALERERLRERAGSQTVVVERVTELAAARNEAEARAYADAAATALPADDPARGNIEAMFAATRARLEERLRLARTVADLRRMIEAVPIPLVAWDDGGAVALMSRSYARLFVARPLEAPDHLAADEVRIAEVAVTEEGAERVYRALSVATGIAEVARLTVLCDITPERTMLQARDETLATTAHELRHPLTAAHAWAQLMQRNVSSIQGQIGQLERLINDLVATGPSPYGKLAVEEFNLGQLVRESVTRIRQLTNANVRLRVPPAEVRVSADAQRLAQALDNILQNAAKYSPPETAIDVTVTRDQEEARIHVRDRGIGIAVEDLPFLFDRSYRSPRTRETGGSGLGLAVAREIVLAHAGRIWAESEGPGKGSVFVIALPVLQERATTSSGR